MYLVPVLVLYFRPLPSGTGVTPQPRPGDNEPTIAARRATAVGAVLLLAGLTGCADDKSAASDDGTGVT
ncbi:hypothetical protein [Kribbella catacumbae]|uniref:hypothetical protein n=1 Tax=Kribbella catacumbae TaxID=460086 RepID=UPI00037864A6|nr:hypothetical protein [Kribbella catacumbae]